MAVETLVPIPAEIEAVGHLVIGCGIAVHRALGPGYRESIYRRAMCLELEDRGISYETEKRITIAYGGRTVGNHRLDFLIEGCVIGELKSVPMIREIHRMQVRSYMKATHLRLGYVMNFNVEVLKNGTKRVVL
jgi:GxxExxY protein